MLENFSILVQKSVKGLGKCAHFPTVALMLLRGRMFRGLFCWSCSPILPKIFINKLPLPLVLSASRKNICKYCILFNLSALCSAGNIVLEYYYKESDKDSLIYFARFNSSELRMGV